MTKTQNTRPKILVTVDLSPCPQALELLRDVGDVVYLVAADRKDVFKALTGCDAYMGLTDVIVDATFLDCAPKLAVICTCSTGTDHLDVKAIKQRKIDLISLTTEYALLDTFTSTAEMAWALLLACRRRLPRLFERAKRGEIGLEDNQPLPPQLAGKTLGVVGYGRLGKMVAEYGKAFRMRVIVCDPYKTIDSPGIEQVDFDTLVRSADVVTLHVHLRDDTYHMINQTVIAKMKPSVTLVNVSRGDLICEADLLQALENGHIASAGLDVVHNEWDPDLINRPLLEYARLHDNLVLSPHVGGGSLESTVDARVFIARKLARYLQSHCGQRTEMATRIGN